MKTIIKNKSRFSFLKKSINELQRSDKPIPNLELLRLYREVQIMTRRFTWANENGEPWKDILRASARKEFEQMREEKDTVKLG